MQSSVHVDEDRFPGLYVADASAIPVNLGVNPSLTITAMSELAMSRIPPATRLASGST